ncbi:hypothetical protein GH714_021934 [Hevea brasiliensis]|uniref:Uncharacterized protein n=1 Tax=Hevea brasiliensis TaxID=3981 RepID=A0A6A6KAF9_HEVBR|nr:hypothetical protein GH714_021934 [Hevea brasiliensis]
MLDHCNQIFSFNPDYQMSSNYDRQADEEFDFWGGGDARYYENFSGEMEFRGHFEEELDDYSGLWKRKARKELMERIHDMPESSYELSLKDIVDEQLTLNKVNKENATERTSFHFNTAETQTKKQRKRKPKNTDKSGQISRSKTVSPRAAGLSSAQRK